MSSPRITALITTFNEEAHIGGCLESLAWCDERIVVDSFSTDRTPEIVRGTEGVRFYQRPYEYAASQKNRALDLPSHGWVVIFDADERCTEKLRSEIETLIASDPPQDAFVIRRKAFLLGHPISYSGWQNDRVARLFRNGSCRYQDRRVHARLLLSDGTVAMASAPVLRSPMEHHMVDSLDEYAHRMLRYGRWGAAQAWLDGKRTSAAQVLLRPLWRFVRTFVFQRGFLDGGHGLVFCATQAYATFVKLMIVWGWQRDVARGIEPQVPRFDRPEPEGDAETESTSSGASGGA